jgi:hypothetical protein
VQAVVPIANIRIRSPATFLIFPTRAQLIALTQLMLLPTVPAIRQALLCQSLSALNHHAACATEPFLGIVVKDPMGLERCFL